MGIVPGCEDAPGSTESILWVLEVRSRKESGLLSAFWSVPLYLESKFVLRIRGDLGPGAVAHACNPSTLGG